MQNLVLATMEQLQLIFRKEAQKMIKELVKELELKNEVDTMDIKECSEFTGLAVQTIYQYVNENKIPFFKVGRKLHFSKKEIRVWQKAKRPQILKNVINEMINKQSPETFVRDGYEAK